MKYLINYLNISSDKISTQEFDDLHEFASHYAYLQNDSNFIIIKVSELK